MSMQKRQRTSGGDQSVFHRVWGTPGTHDGQFNYPKGITIGTDGVIYIADSKNNRLLRSNQCFDSDGVFIRKWGHLGSEDGRFYKPVGIALGERYGMPQSLITAMCQVAALSAFPPGLLPICLAYVGNECVYVTEYGNHRVQVFECEGKYLRKWGSQGFDNGQFHGPYGCSTGAAGRVYVCDSGNDRLLRSRQVFSNDGTFLSEWSGLINGHHEFLTPIAVALSNDGLVFVVEKGRHVHCLRSDGTFVCKWGSRGSDRGFSCGSSGVMVSEEMVYIADIGNQSVQQFRMDGTFMREWDGDEEVLFDPVGIAKGLNGLLYISDCCNNRIVVMTVSAGHLKV